MECPQCNGKKEILGLFAIRSDGSGCELARMFPCHRCHGTGAVPEEMSKWIETGKRLRADRLARNMTLRQEAKARGIRTSELANMEWGRVDPDNPPPPLPRDENPTTAWVYAITTYRREDGRPWPWRNRTVGLLPDEKSAVRCVEENQGDLEEAGWYQWAVVEKVELGLYPSSADSAIFYAFDRAERRWVRLDARPEQMPENLSSFHTIG